jgi:carboxylate-amine ligase
VTDLCARYEDGEDGLGMRRELLDENKWRALRYGHDAAFVSRDRTGTVSLGDLVEREADRLDVPGLIDLYDRESGASRQRRLMARSRDDLCESLLLERA